MKRDHDAKMAELKRAFDGGRKRAWLDAIYVCICSSPEKPVPEWAKSALRQALFDVMSVKATSWDDVLGKPHSGRKLAQIRRQRSKQWPVFWRVCELREVRPKPLDPLQVAADEFGISRATAKRLVESVQRDRRIQTPKQQKASAMAITQILTRNRDD